MKAKKLQQGIWAVACVPFIYVHSAQAEPQPTTTSNAFSNCIMIMAENDLAAQPSPQLKAGSFDVAWRPGSYKKPSYSGSGGSKKGYANDSGFSLFRSAPPSQGPAHAHGTVVFNPRTLTWAAYDSSGSLVKYGRASGGKGYCPDVGRSCRTPVGHFQVFAKGSADCKSSKYPLEKPGAPMPYCMYFHKAGYAVHGSYDVPNYNASHGCVRVTPSDAYWLHSNFVRPGTKVIVRPY